ncbi:MAG: 3-oxoacyl-ACP reductase FabG [Verrucomicrobia bacterium]|nr:3-oxoacyl-ACP reductase FabG [Verrucomicrobiota bacterium]MDA1086010.1 3-oxoacyl-ACP reductase FabG [Verrucomicrobiota bacterium]
MTLAGRTALVTGGSRGIGRAIAMALARAGAAVGINYVNDADAAADTVREIDEAGGSAVAVRTDVRDTEAVAKMVAEVRAALGPVGILVNNAGVLRDKPITFMSDQEWDDVVDINLRGAFTCIKAVGRDMMRARYGRIINISSAAGITGDAMRASYVAAKAGMIGLTKAAAREFATSGVTANAIAPGVIETDMIKALSDAKRAALLERVPLGHFGEPDDVARAAIFLASDRSGYITGQVLSVDGGMVM